MPERFVFSDLRELFAKANEVKSGDQLAGIAAASERERVAAKRQLADLSLGEIVRNPLIDPDQDDVSRLILDSFDQEKFQPLKSMTVGEFRERLLDDATTESELCTIQRAIIPEIAAAVAKIMSNKDLVLAAARFATSRVAATRWVSAAFWAFGCSRIIRWTISEAFCSPRLKACCMDAATR